MTVGKRSVQYSRLERFEFDRNRNCEKQNRTFIVFDIYI